MACLDSAYWSAHILPFKCSVCLRQKVTLQLNNGSRLFGHLMKWNPRGKLSESVHEQVQQQSAAALKEGGEAEWKRIKTLCLSEGMRQLERVCRSTMDGLIPLFCINIYSLCMVLSKVTVCLFPLRSCWEKWKQSCAAVASVNRSLLQGIIKKRFWGHMVVYPGTL